MPIKDTRIASATISLRRSGRDPATCLNDFSNSAIAATALYCHNGDCLNGVPSDSGRNTSCNTIIARSEGDVVEIEEGELYVCVVLPGARSHGRWGPGGV